MILTFSSRSVCLSIGRYSRRLGETVADRKKRQPSRLREIVADWEKHQPSRLGEIVADWQKQ